MEGSPSSTSTPAGPRAGTAPGMDRRSWSFLALGALAGMLTTSAAFAWLSRARSKPGTAAQGRPTISSAARVLKLAHALDEKHPVHLSMIHFAEQVETRSAGQLRVELFPNGQLGSETDTIEQLQRGVLAFAKSSAAPLESFIPTMGLFGLPYLFRDRHHFFEVLDGDIGEELLLEGLGVGIRGLCFLDAGSRSFYTKRAPVLVPSDLEGLKIRVMKSRSSMDMVSAMGGAPTPMPFGELYTALQQGMVDGAENNPPSFLGSRHFEVAKHYSLDEHARIPDILLSSETIHASLSPQERSWVKAAALSASTFQRELWQRETERVLDELENQGVSIYHPDQAPFQTKVRALYEGLAPQLARWVERIVLRADSPSKNAAEPLEQRPQP